MCEINFPATACAFIPKKIFNEVGLFDEKFFAYLDDTDFGWRAMKQGIKSFFVPSVIVYHKWSSTTKWSPLKYYLLERNRLICINTLFSKKTISILRPFLNIINFGVSRLYKKNGMLEEKKRADEFIEKNKEYLLKKFTDIQNKTIIDDFHLIKDFSDSIHVPGAAFGKLWVLNSFLYISSKIDKFLIR